MMGRESNNLLAKANAQDNKNGKQRRPDIASMVQNPDQYVVDSPQGMYHIQDQGSVNKSEANFNSLLQDY